MHLKLEAGMIVCSKAGRDKAKFMVVVKTEGDFVFLSDGKERPLERPKRKNIKHISLTSRILTESEMSTNRALKRAIKASDDEQ